MDTPQRSAVRRTVVPVALGALAMLAALVGPGWLSGAVAVVGALVAGALNPDEPVRAGVLTVALPVIGGLIRVLVDEPSALGAFVLAAISAAVLALVASHVGAGIQRRRVSAGPV